MLQTNHAYTDAPDLPPSFFVGSFRLLFWLFFHPSAWRNHIHSLDLGLPPDFCLAELNGRQLRSPALWRLLVMAFLAWPLLLALLIGTLLRLLPMPLENAVFGIIVGLGIGVIVATAVSIAGSVAVGIASGMAVGLVVGLVGGATSGNGAFPGLRVLQLPLEVAVIGLASGLAGGLAFGIAIGIGRRRVNVGSSYSVMRQVTGVVVGILIGLGAGVVADLASGRLATGLIVGLLFGPALYWRTHSLVRGLGGGMLVAALVTLAGGLPRVVSGGGLLGLLVLAILMGSLFTLPYVLAERIAGPWAGALAGALGSGGGFFLFTVTERSFGPFLLFSLAGILLGLTLAWWRPILFYPFLAAWNFLLFRLDEQRLVDKGDPAQASLFRLHSAFWDEGQRLQLLGLDTYLLLVLARRPSEGEAALAYLRRGPQRWAAQSVQIRQDARYLEQCDDIRAIGRAHRALAAGELSGPASALLRSFSRISRDVEAARQQGSAFNQRLALDAVEDRLDGLLRELKRSNEPYTGRFHPVAERWRLIVSNFRQKLAHEAEARQEIDNPYIIGVPLTERQEIFIGRTDISSRIEQLLLDRRRPPLLLYGQRRVGKTSLLNNLGRLLPSTIVPMFVDLQGPASQAGAHQGFLYNVARSMVRSAERQRQLVLPPLTREALAVDPFTCFDEWLEVVETCLGGNMALLLLDEFEVLERAFDRGTLDEEAILGTLRHIIQHRPRFKLLLSGSHTLDELQRWASYLINVQVIHIGYLREAETRQLVEAPVQGFALQYEAEASRQMVELTRGHPFLVQLLAAEVVASKNEQHPSRRRLATTADVEAAVPAALSHGSLFFADIEQQASEVERELLSFIARQGGSAARSALVGYIPSLLEMERGLARLRQRELLEKDGDGYRFQVELVRRWFADRPNWALEAHKKVV